MVAKGWSDNAEDRPSIKSFLEECKLLNDSNHGELIRTIRETTFTVTEQTRTVGLETMPVPLISMKWIEDLEVLKFAFYL